MGSVGGVTKEMAMAEESGELLADVKRTGGGRHYPVCVCANRDLSDCLPGLLLFR